MRFQRGPSTFPASRQRASGAILARPQRGSDADPAKCLRAPSENVEEPTRVAAFDWHPADDCADPYNIAEAIAMSSYVSCCKRFASQSRMVRVAVDIGRLLGKRALTGQTHEASLRGMATMPSVQNVPMR